MKDSKIGFRLVSINTIQFATIDVGFDKNYQLELDGNIVFGINEENKFLACFCRFQFMTDKSNFMIIEVQFEFGIDEEYWGQNINLEKKTIVFPMGFLKHLATISVGATRGILHAKTEKTKFNEFILPTINVTEIISEDGEFDIKNL